MNNILFIGVGTAGSKTANKLSKEGYNCLAVHADYNLEKELDCPQLNLFDNHWRPNEYSEYTENPENVKMLVEENKEIISDILSDFFLSAISENTKNTRL